MTVQIQLRRDTAANWTSVNPVLATGEVGLETDTRQLKIGDGATAWNSLLYAYHSLATETLWAAKGDLVVATADNAAGVLTAPATRSMVLTADAVGNLSWAPNRSGPRGVRISDEMLHFATVTVTSGSQSFSLGPTSLSLSGTATEMTAAVIASTTNHPGVCSLNTGSTSTGRATFVLAPATGILFGGGRCRFGAWVQVPSLSVAASQKYQAGVGFMDSAAFAVVDGAWFSYVDDVNSGKWLTNTSSNSTPATDDSGVTVSAGSWYLLEIEVNAAGTSVDFYINGSLVNTETTQIPTGTGRETGAMITMLKSVGATARNFYVDAWYLELDFTTAR